MKEKRERVKKRVFFSLLPFLALIIYYAIGGAIRFGEGRPEAFVFDKKYGYILKCISLVLPIYLAAVNRKIINRKSAFKAFLAIFIGEILFICGIESGDKHILETYGRDMSLLIWYVGWVVILSLLISIWWLTFAAISEIKNEKDYILKTILPGAVVVIGAMPSILGNGFFDVGVDWITEFLSLMWLFLFVFIAFSSAIYPAYLVILNRKNLNSKKHWLNMAGSIVIYNVITVVIAHLVDSRDWYIGLLPACFNEIIFFGIAFAVVKWFERRKQKEEIL